MLTGTKRLQHDVKTNDVLIYRWENVCYFLYDVSVRFGLLTIFDDMKVLFMVNYIVLLI